MKIVSKYYNIFHENISNHILNILVYSPARSLDLNDEPPTKTKRLRKSVHRYMEQRRSQQKLQRIIQIEKNKLKKLLDKNSRERAVLTQKMNVNQQK